MRAVMQEGHDRIKLQKSLGWQARGLNNKQRQNRTCCEGCEASVQAGCLGEVEQWVQLVLS